MFAARSLSQNAFPSTSLRALRIKSKMALMFSNILVGMDASPCSDLALDYAIVLAKRYHAKLSECHALNYAAAFDVSLEPSPGILEVAATIEADLIVVGNHGKKSWERLFNASVSGKVLNGAHVPLLVIPHDASCAADRAA